MHCIPHRSDFQKDHFVCSQTTYEEKVTKATYLFILYWLSRSAILRWISGRKAKSNRFTKQLHLVLFHQN